MKRLITCSDGTWNKPENKDRGLPVETNVEKMFRAICSTDNSDAYKPVRQLKIYDQGVGTGYTWKDRLIGGATGAGIDKNIKDMYTFLMLNYDPGDQIYLFGFSRGAYTARSIGGLIRNCGILRPENIMLVDKAYNLYRDRNKYSSPDSDLMTSFRHRYSHEDQTPVHFIGVWDTVGSLGIPLPWYKLRNRNRYKFHDLTLGSTVQHAYHALAIDEKRRLFLPTLWQQSSTVINNPYHPQKMEQRWFSGVHSNVGGGYADCGLSDIPLNWLLTRANEAGLCFEEERLNEIKPNYLAELRNSYTPLYWFWFPAHRELLNPEYPNQTIDESAYRRMKENLKYRPKNIPKDQTP
ncbi:MAG: DUF2235 domain-containing protein [Chitinophagaceae bacterium]